MILEDSDGGGGEGGAGGGGWWLYIHGSSWSNWAEQLSHHVNRPRMRRGRSVMTAGLKGGDGRVHFAGIKFRNRNLVPPPHPQIDHEMVVVVTNRAHHSCFLPASV